MILVNIGINRETYEKKKAKICKFFNIISKVVYVDTNLNEARFNR